MPTIDITTEQLKDKALDWINGIRQEHGLEPLTELPKGERGKAEDCVLARAASGLGDHSCPTPPGGGRNLGGEPIFLSFSHRGKTEQREAPPEVVEFLRRFDNGDFPELAA